MCNWHNMSQTVYLANSKTKKLIPANAQEQIDIFSISDMGFPRLGIVKGPLSYISLCRWFQRVT